MTDLPPPPGSAAGTSWGTPPAGAGFPPPPAGPQRVTKGVLGVAVVTLLALVGVIAWGGGEAPKRPTAASPGGEPGVLGGGEGGLAIPGSASASGSGPSESSAPLPPFDADALIPVGGIERPPTSSMYDREWLVPGRTWTDVQADYQRSFPVPGWELGFNVVRVEDGTEGMGYEIQAAGRSKYDGVAGQVVFEVDPNDPTSSIVEFRERE